MGMAQPYVIMAMRGGSLALKLLLVFYIGLFLGLEDLGAYGLIAGAATIGPILLSASIGLPPKAPIAELTSRPGCWMITRISAFSIM